MDGVRLNQPFGDVVSWDLIPRMAIGSTTLMPGSNPLFGLNTLGGAFSTPDERRAEQSGHHRPGDSTAVDMRRAVEFEHGGSRATGCTGTWPGICSRKTAGATIRHRASGNCSENSAGTSCKAETALSVGYADNALTGNGLQEQRFLDRDYCSVYTKPDETDNRSTFLNLTTRRDWSRTLTFTGNVYYRHIRTNTFNGDINDDSLDQAVYQPTRPSRRR